MCINWYLLCSMLYVSFSSNHTRSPTSHKLNHYLSSLLKILFFKVSLLCTHRILISHSMHLKFMSFFWQHCFDLSKRACITVCPATTTVHQIINYYIIIIFNPRGCPHLTSLTVSPPFICFNHYICSLLCHYWAVELQIKHDCSSRFFQNGEVKFRLPARVATRDNVTSKNISCRKVDQFCGRDLSGKNGSYQPCKEI